LSWKREPRRMYFRTCFKERWRVCSRRERSEAPPAAAEVARPERSEWPEDGAHELVLARTGEPGHLVGLEDGGEGAFDGAGFETPGGLGGVGGESGRSRGQTW
jgi:hypothetical protein